MKTTMLTAAMIALLATVPAFGMGTPIPDLPNLTFADCKAKPGVTLPSWCKPKK